MGLLLPLLLFLEKRPRRKCEMKAWIFSPLTPHMPLIPLGKLTTTCLSRRRPPLLVQPMVSHHHSSSRLERPIPYRSTITIPDMRLPENDSLDRLSAHSN